MLLKMELLSPIRRGICEMKGTVYVGSKICTEADHGGADRKKIISYYHLV